jgi:hypothetical protein
MSSEAVFTCGAPGLESVEASPDRHLRAAGLPAPDRTCDGPDASLELW